MDKKDWIPSYDLEKVSTPYGWIGLRGTRTCRDLAKKGVIEKKMIDGYIHYRWPETKPTEAYNAPQKALPPNWGMIKDENGVLFKF